MKYILQIHFRNLTKAESLLLPEALLKKEFTYDLRLEMNETSLIHWEIYPEGIEIINAKALLRPTQKALWLKTVQVGGYVTEVDSLFTKLFTIDLGEYRTVKIGRDVFTYNFTGNFLKGEYQVRKDASRWKFVRKES